jgi:hypothetical protein
LISVAPLPPHISKLPRWSDDEGVAKLVEEEFLEWERLDAEDRQLGQHQLPDITHRELWDAIERDAIEASIERTSSR